MDLRTKRTICLLVGIASILTIVSTVSYAYFTAIADLNPVESVINTATVSAKFSDYGAEVGGTLGFGEFITKRFTIENTGTTEANVKMYWVDLINTYLEGSLTYTLSYSENEEGPYTEEVGKTNVPQSKSTSKKELVNSLTIPVGKTYYYNLVITLNYLEDVNQDSDIEAVFNSKFGIEDINYEFITPTTNIIAANQGIRTSFDSPSTTDEGIFEIEDDYGTSYYFRGAVENNYVQFAGFYWRIIRINGNGSLRIIYDGTIAHRNGEASSDRVTHSNQQFNTLANDAKYAGWMYGPANEIEGKTTPSTSKEEAQSNIEDSTIKKVVDAWYKTNIEDKGYGQYVSDTLFCNDRSTPGKSANGWTSDTELGYGKNDTGYGGFKRFIEGNNSGQLQTTAKSDIEPAFKCPQKNDAFTVSDTVVGNGALEYPVGLITVDEIVTAGSGKYHSSNNKYYLYKGPIYWTISPVYYITGTRNYEYTFFEDGGGLAFNYVLETKGCIAPVINLSVEYVSTMIGDGTMENPYRASNDTP